ncbi:hypothetical protein L6452_31739 [Arctium lappa]|uniref:Uncharacterized protein n=1 Tax=Arctium lappa TaxID=4217 RepID=A0ACB8Z395_ARCLA|nr:hypothetical protein L6452_31739 [Arctium lappa]
MNISRHHARIFYNFHRRRFALEILGKNVCFVEGVLHLPGTHPVKLDSQDLLQIGDKEFYFLLPVRSILGGPIGPPRHHVPNPNTVKSGRGRVMIDFEDAYEDDEMDDSGVTGVKKIRRGVGDGIDAYASYGAPSGSGGKSHSGE